MSTLVVWTFDTSHGAEGAGRTLQRCPDLELAEIQDAAYASWARESGKPSTGVLRELSRDEGTAEAFWGVFFGLSFFSPLLGAAVGRPPGRHSGSLTDLGIDDTFVNRVRDTVTPGTSALFVRGPDVVVDQVGDWLRADQPVKVLFTRLDGLQDPGPTSGLGEHGVANGPS
jgi:uncharacterized membrane protein